VHVKEVTQPQGHSTSGSHERYKPDERLEWEEEFCCINKMRSWMLEEGLATEEELQAIEEEAKSKARNGKNAAWETFTSELKSELKRVNELLDQLIDKSASKEQIRKIKKKMNAPMVPLRHHIVSAARKACRVVRGESTTAATELKKWLQEMQEASDERYGSHLYSQSEASPLSIDEVKPS